MALTITTLSGLKGTLVVDVTSNYDVTLKVVNGKVVFTNTNNDVATYLAPTDGTASASGATVADFATNGIPVTANTNPIIMTAATFATAGLPAKLNGNAGAINATGAGATVMNSLVSNVAKIADGAISGAIVTAAQFAPLAAKFDDLGVLKLNAAGASVAQWGTIADNLDAIALGTATNGIYGASVNSSNLADFADAIANVKTGGATKVDLSGLGPNDIGALVANPTKIANNVISNAALTAAQFNALDAQLAKGGAIYVDAGAIGTSSADIQNLVTNKAKIAAGAIDNAELSAAQFSSLTSQLANGGAASVVGTGATTTAAQVNALANNAAKLADESVSNVAVTAAQFAKLQAASPGGKLDSTNGGGALTVNAAGASVSQIQSLINNTGAITNGSATSGIYNAKLTGLQFDALVAELKTGGVLQINASDLDAAGFNANVTANLGTKVAAGAIVNASILHGDFAGNEAYFAKGGVKSMSGVVTGDFNNILNNRAKIANGAITGATLSAAEFSQITALVANGGISHLDLDDVVGAGLNAALANQAKLASGSIQNGRLTVSQFQTLLTKLQDLDNLGVAGVETMAATGKESVAQINAILGNLGKFEADAMTGLALTAAQYNSLATDANFVTLSNTMGGVLKVSASSAGTIGTGDTASLVKYGSGNTDATLSITGSSGADVIYAGVRADTVNGGSGNDSIFGGDGADSLLGGNGDDTISGGAGADTLVGGAGNDSLTGGADADTFNIDAGSDEITDLAVGADILTVAAGASVTAEVDADWINATGTSNAGTATLNLAGTAAADTLSLANATVVGTVGYTLNAHATTQSTITGSGGNDIITGSTTGGDSLIGGNGADSISGLGGNDVLEGGAGADTLVGGTGDDNLTGGADADTFSVTAGTDTITDLGVGDDILTVVANSAVNATNVLNWTATAATSNEGSATLTLKGVAGTADELDLSAATVTAAIGYTLNAGAATASTITGSIGNDSITGSSAADSLVGGAGNDTIVGGEKGDVLTGGLGVDTYGTSGNFGASGQSVLASAVTLTAAGIAAGNSWTFGTAADGNVDVVTDFVGGVDKLDVTAGAAGTAPTNLVTVSVANSKVLDTAFVAYGSYNTTSHVFTIAATFDATTAKDAVVYVGDGTLTAANTTGAVVLTGLSQALASGDFI